MFYVKLFGSGLDQSHRDPRNKIWAEYKCALCGKTSDIDVTRVMDTFDFDRDRRCTHCGQIDIVDKKINLKSQLEKLTVEKSRIEIQIERVIRELNEIVNISVTNK
jgi:DNA-directed RNA polymerase subunit RPC12/RpoP